MTHRLGPAVRVLAVVVLAGLFAVPSAGIGRADEEESMQAAVLVEQAVGLIANEAPDDRVAERINDALEAPDQAGVDRADVAQALALIEAPGEVAAATERARTLLLDSLDGQLPSAPEHPKRATGTETGTSVILDEFRPDRGISDRGDAVLLGVALAAILAGLYLARRLRPAHPLRQLTHPAAEPVDSQEGKQR